MGANARDGTIPEDGVNGHQKESKLELFGFDSLVNILGLKRYTRAYLLLAFRNVH